ncbi:hypothetical protein ACOSP7_017116 [Xanthoceras sorbifolium]
MSSNNAINLSSIQQTSHVNQLSLATLGKSIAISGLVLFLFYTLMYNHPYKPSSDIFTPFIEQKWPSNSPYNVTNPPTNISHIMFVLAGSIKTWNYRKPYIEAWWRPNRTRGNLWLDVAPTEYLLPWSPSSPPFRINEDVTQLKNIHSKMVDPIQVRMYRSILETFKLGENKDVRWYVMADDDSLIFIDNLVEMLGRYDHNKYYYIGKNSECVHSNFQFSFDMGYGGAGYALSYALVEVLASNIDGCIERYQHLITSDYMSQSCLADLGVDLTIEMGLHQIDLVGDISGLLSAHPKAPLISLHHFDTINPIFPSKNQSESINNLMEAANIDQSRLLQQTICYYRPSNWTFSISWGYSAHVYESILPRSILRKPLETFKPWQKVRPPFFMFTTRWPSDDPCQAPHVFFLETIQNNDRDNLVLTSYVRSSPRNLRACSSNANHSAEPVSRIRVFSPATARKEYGKIECCDVEYVPGNDTADVKLRACMKGEMLA